jgi:hypothetical protein
MIMSGGYVLRPAQLRQCHRFQGNCYVARTPASRQEGLGMSMDYHGAIAKLSDYKSLLGLTAA